MACLPCITNLLDDYPDVRSTLYNVLDKMLELEGPLANLQAELDDANSFLDAIQADVAAFNLDILGASELYDDIQTAMDTEGILPGSCPLLDSALTNINAFAVTLNGLKNPVTKHISMMQSRIAQVSQMASIANTLITQAEDFRC